MNIYRIILILFLSNPICKGQSLDTLKFFNEVQLITDLSLNDHVNCLGVDTTVVLHACHDFHGEDILLHYYQIEKEVCDSIASIPTDAARNKTKYDMRTNSPRIKQKIRLIPDVKIGWPNVFISAEVLFQISIGTKKYNFNSLQTFYEIDKESLEKGISIVERIPNAFTYFGDERIVVIVVFEDKEICLEPIDEHLYRIPKSINGWKESIKQLKISIRNECADKLTMIFKTH